MLYADEAVIVSRSSEGLERMMTVMVIGSSSIGLSVTEAKTDIVVPGNQRRGEGVLYNQCSQPGIQTNSRVRVPGRAHHRRHLSIEIRRRLPRAWACFQWYKMERYDRPGVCLRLKVRLLILRWSRHLFPVA